MKGNGTKVWQFAAAIIGTVLVSILGAFYVFGASQAEQLVRLEQSEAEDARQRQIDQALVRTLSEAFQLSRARVGELETRIAVLEAQIGQEQQP